MISYIVKRLSFYFHLQKMKVPKNIEKDKQEHDINQIIEPEIIIRIKVLENDSIPIDIPKPINPG